MKQKPILLKQCGKCGTETDNPTIINERVRCPSCLVNVRPAIIGDIFVNTWGYDQTNADFYQVVGLTPKCLKLKRIKGKVTQNGFMSGQSVPIKDGFKSDEVIRKQVYLYDGVPHVAMEYGACELWDGKPESCSWYA